MRGPIKLAQHRVLDIAAERALNGSQMRFVPVAGRLHPIGEPPPSPGPCAGPCETARQESHAVPRSLPTPTQSPGLSASSAPPMAAAVRDARGKTIQLLVRVAAAAHRRWGTYGRSLRPKASHDRLQYPPRSV